jgi:integrase
MAAPVKVDGKWKHRVMISGVRHTGTFTTKAQAIAWEAQQRTKPPPGASAATTQTCKDAFDRYEREVSKTKRGYRWEALRLAALGKSDLGRVRLADVDATHVAAWRDERLRSVQGATVTRELNLLSHVFTVARKEWKWIAASPTTDVSRPRAAPSRDRRVTQSEIDLICAALGHAEGPPQTKQQAIALAFLWAIETAMRAGEICALTGADVTGRVAHLRMTKNGTSRDVGLSPRAVEIWGFVPDGFGISSASLDAMFRKARQRAGVEGLTFHDTRHEAITRLAKKLNVLELARMVGHTDIRQLQLYFNETAENIADRL